MRIRLLLLAAVAGCCLLIAGVAGAKPAPTKGAPAQFTVWAGTGWVKALPPGVPKNVPQTADANMFFPQQLTIHVGDWVTFKSGDLHTATLLGPRQVSEFPPFIPDPAASLYSGINDSLGAPFFFNGMPKFIYNPALFAPAGSTTISNRLTFHNSGVLDTKGYSYHFTKVGIYVLHCLIHPMMTERVVVQPRRAYIPSVLQDKAAMVRELIGAAKVAVAIDQIVPTTPNTVYVGVGKMVMGGSVELMTYKPQVLTVKAGTTVTFETQSPMEIHNVTFGPQAWIKTFMGQTDLSPTGPGSPNQASPLYFYGSDAATNGAYSYDGTNHGNGFLATALVGPGPPFAKSVQITFTKPGVYKYFCIIHGPMMSGEIDVQ